MHLGVPCIPRKNPKQQEKTELTSRRSLPPGLVQVGNISAEAAALPQQEDPTSLFPRRRHGATPNSEIRWAAQAIITLGGTICHQSSSQEQLILLDRLHQGDQAQGHVRSGDGAAVQFYVRSIVERQELMYATQQMISKVVMLLKKSI